jgi:hypothetical protein
MRVWTLRGRESETVDHDGMDGAVAQQVEQCSHVGLEILRSPVSGFRNRMFVALNWLSRISRFSAARA